MLPAYRQRSNPKNANCPCGSTTCNARELARHLHSSQPEASRHVGIDNIRYCHCPHFSACDLSMSTEMNNSKLRIPSPDTYHHGDLRRALIQAALELAAEEKDWSFSLRELARR